MAASVACVSASLIGGSIAGCKSGPSQEEQAKENWDAARGRVLQQLAVDQLNSGQLQEARRTCDQALAVTDKLPGLYLLSARIDVERNELSTASASLRYARLLKPEASVAAEIEHVSGVIAERWEQPEKAVDHHRLATKLDPGEANYLITYAETLVGANRLEEAAEALRARVVFFEGNAAVRDALGQVLQAQGRHAEAAEMFRQASVLAPEDEEIRERLALAWLQAGEISRAALLLERLVGEPAGARSVSLHVALGECRLARGEASSARAAFQRAARLDPAHVPAWLGVAKASLDDHDLSRVELALDKARQLAPGRADVRLLTGYLRLRQGRLNEAAAEFATASQADPSDATAPLMYGYCLQQLGEHEAAVPYLRRALRLDPSDTLATTLLSRSAAAAPQAVANTDGRTID